MPHIPAFPQGDFLFFALDVETANRDRASICQIGVACVHTDHRISTWATYVDPQTSDWSCTGIHGITGRTVIGAPLFHQVLPLLTDVLAERTIYQHSGFDRSAMTRASLAAGIKMPEWQWQDSVIVARKAWPHLRGQGGHGLANLKHFLGLQFNHHDAGEDARAAAEVVLHAQGIRKRNPTDVLIEDE